MSLTLLKLVYGLLHAATCPRHSRYCSVAPRVCILRAANNVHFNCLVYKMVKILISVSREEDIFKCFCVHNQQVFGCLSEEFRNGNHFDPDVLIKPVKARLTGLSSTACLQVCVFYL